MTDVCRVLGNVLVEQPTGSGKTIEIVTLAAMQLGRRFGHAVIAAPQDTSSTVSFIATIGWWRFQIEGY